MLTVFVSRTSGKFLSTRHHHSLFKRIVFGNQRDGGSFTALKIVFSMAAVRLSKAFESCREEQVECADSGDLFLYFSVVTIDFVCLEKVCSTTLVFTIKQKKKKLLRLNFIVIFVCI